MTLSALVKQYRERNEYSMRDFAKKCGTSHSYIAMIENEKNSKTGEPIVPSLAMIKKIAHGLDMTINELITLCDDMPVSLSDVKFVDKTAPTEPKLSEGEEMLLKLFRKLPQEAQDSYIERLEEAIKTLGLI